VLPLEKRNNAVRDDSSFQSQERHKEEKIGWGNSYILLSDF
jgi:hypothetical protein